MQKYPAQAGLRSHEFETNDRAHNPVPNGANPVRARAREARIMSTFQNPSERWQVQTLANATAIVFWSKTP